MIQALRVFAVAAAEESFSGAARRLGMSQPSVSGHVRSLEQHYGVQLFERGGREARLTAAGQRLYEHADRVLAAFEDLERDVRALKDGTGNVLEVVASPIPGEAILPLLLPRFRALEPNARVRERIGSAPDIVDRLLRRVVEIGVIVGPYYDERLEAVLWGRDEFALIVPREHPLAERGPVRLVEVCQHPLVLRRGGSGTHLVVESALLAAGVERASIKVAAELGNTGAVKRAVRAGLGVGFVSVCTLAEAGPEGDVQILPLADEPPARDLLVVTERGRARTALAESFHRFLVAPETLRQVDALTRLPAALRRASDGPADPRRSAAAAVSKDDAARSPA